MKRALIFGALLALCGAALAVPVPEGPVYLDPIGPGYDANTGSYHREIEIVKPIWATGADKAISGINPFQSKGATTPSFTSGNYTLGEGHGGTFIGGDMTEWQDAVRRGPVLLMIIGGLMLAAGIIVAIWARRVVLGLAVAAAGMALIATAVLFELYPWVVLIALAAVLGIGIWWFIDAKGLLKTRKALGAVVVAVDRHPEVKADIQAAAKSAKAETEIRSTIRKAKKAAKLD